MRLHGLLPLAVVVAASASLRAQSPSSYTAALSGRATSVVTLSPPRGASGAPARIRVDYGQPHLRGRSLHAGGLVPFDSVWRAGANEATAFETDVDLSIGGTAVPKGKYTLYALPTNRGWTLIINKNTGQWGTEYDAKHDLARVPLRHRPLRDPVESLIIALVPASATAPATGQLRIVWGTADLSADWSVR
jgi:DUF2911 family protein